MYAYWKLQKTGYNWWWHSFTATHEVTKEEKSFFIEFFLCNPAQAQSTPVFEQLPGNRDNNIQPSYLMVVLELVVFNSITKNKVKLKLVDDITTYHIGCEYGEYI